MVDSNAPAAAAPANAPAAGTEPAAAAAAAAAAPAAPAAAAGGAAAGAPVVDDKATTAAAAAAKGPVVYALKVPEAATQFLDAADLKKLEAQAKANGLTNEEAQAALENTAKDLIDTSERFRAETEADATYGGDHLADTQKFARHALEKFAPKGTPEGDAFRRDLEKSGYGNKLTVVGFLARLGKAISEDRPDGGRSNVGAGATDAASVLYGKS